MQTKTIYWLLAAGVMLAIGCKKDQQACNDPYNIACPNYDPCLNVNPAYSDIAIVDSSRWTDTLMSFEVDTVTSTSKFFFRPKEIRSNTSYAWRIGQDNRIFETPVVDLLFTGFQGQIDATLTATVQDQDRCLPEVERSSTSTKSIYVLNIPVGEYPLWGVYNGKTDNEEDEYEVSVVGLLPNSVNNSYRLLGLQVPNCDMLNDIGVPIGGSYSWFISEFVNRSASRRCHNLLVVGQLSKENRNELTLHYWYDAPDGKRVHKIFTGYRQ